MKTYDFFIEKANEILTKLNNLEVFDLHHPQYSTQTLDLSNNFKLEISLMFEQISEGYLFIKYLEGDLIVDSPENENNIIKNHYKLAIQHFIQFIEEYKKDNFIP